MSLDGGARDKKVSLQRSAAQLDEAGHPTVNQAWTEVCKAYASIAFGTGTEQREAAQESARQAATFEVPSNARTRTLRAEDRICYPITDPDPAKWPAWDITSAHDMGHNEGVRITATRMVN